MCYLGLQCAGMYGMHGGTSVPGRAEVIYGSKVMKEVINCYCRDIGILGDDEGLGWEGHCCCNLGIWLFMG